MKLKTKEKLEAIRLREKGYSLNEILQNVGVAKSSISMWVRNVSLTADARKRLLTKIKLGQLISAERKHAKTLASIQNHFDEASSQISNINLDRFLKRLICSLLYWCEGTKNQYTGVAFVNSDPKLIKTFIELFRDGFDVDEKKFRACIHLHEYHNSQKQHEFWAKVADIPLNQFRHPYLKPNTGKRVRKNYQGCISIRYYSNDIARQLLTTAEAFLLRSGGIG